MINTAIINTTTINTTINNTARQSEFQDSLTVTTFRIQDTKTQRKNSFPVGNENLNFWKQSISRAEKRKQTVQKLMSSAFRLENTSLLLLSCHLVSCQDKQCE